MPHLTQGPKGLAVRPQDLGIGRLFENVRDAVIVAEASTGRIVLWNEAATEIFGYSPSEALELRVEDLVPERLKAQHQAGMARYHDTGHGPYIDSRTVLGLPAVLKTGEEIRVEFTLSPVETADAPGTGGRFVLAILRDVTERERAEEEIGRLNEGLERRVAERTAELEATVARLQSSERTLGESEERYRLLVEGAKDYAIFMVDPEGRVNNWNEGAERVFGYREEEIVGEHGSLLFTPEDRRRGADEEELRKARDEGRAQDERWHLRKDGSRFFASGFVRPVRDEAGNLIGFSKVARDITERKEAEERTRFLADLNGALQPLTDPDELTATAARMLGEHLGADRCAYAEVETDEDHFTITGDYANGVPSIVGRFAMSDFGAEALRLSRENEPYVVTDVEADERISEQDLAAYRQTRIRAVVSVPLHKAGRFAAGMAVHQKTPRRWSREEVELVGTVAERCWESMERARAVRELRLSEERYRSLVAASSSIVWTIDPGGRFVEPQPLWEAYTGQTWEEHRGFGWMRALHPDDRDRVGGIWERARDGRSPYESEGRLFHAPSGTYRYFVARATPLLDASGSIREWVGMVNDVDDRRRAEEAVRFLAEASAVLASSLGYRETLASVARLAVPRLADWCAVDVLEEDGSLERLAVAHPDPEKVALAYELQERYPTDPDAPRGMHQVLRTGQPELIPEIPRELIEQAARDERHGEILRELGLRSYMVVPLVARGRTLGTLAFVTAESGRRYGEADLKVAEELARRAAMAVDNARLYEEAQREIDERKRAEEALRESEERMRFAVDAARLGSWDLDLATGAARRSLRHDQIFGYEELLPEWNLDLFLQHVHPEDRAFVRRCFDDAAETGGAWEFECRIFRPDGALRWIWARGTPYLDENGQPVRFLGGVIDITERKRAEESLREVREAERSRMARDLHDGALQDITYALAEAQLVGILAAGTELNDRLEQVVGALERGSQGLREAVYDLRLQEERDRPLPEALEALLEMNRRMNPRCDMRLEVGGGVPSSPLGETGIEVLRIVQEALNNVRRHSGAENAVVSLSAQGSELVAEIEDDGRGFDTNASQPGGIGQKSMRERAAALGGRLEVQSEPGKGTRVRVRVPLSVPNGDRDERKR